MIILFYIIVALLALIGPSSTLSHSRDVRALLQTLGVPSETKGVLFLLLLYYNCYYNYDAMESWRPGDILTFACFQGGYRHDVDCDLGEMTLTGSTERRDIDDNL